LFNASLDCYARRSVDIREGEEVDVKAFKALIRATALNAVAGAKPKRRKTVS
jgi:hypothetical protein